MINYISNLPADLRSGGFSAMNVAAMSAMKTLGDIRYVGPVNPASTLVERAASKALRTIGGQGAFFTFSDRRLKEIAQQVAASAAPEATFDFFHGFTPWIRTAPKRPYVAWSDCTFHDYIRIYHPPGRFSPADLSRIESLEQAWLSRAHRVMFTSQWACDRAVEQYSLDPAKVGSVGIFGEIELPAEDLYDQGQGFAFISTNFAAKGGHTVLEAFRRVRRSHPQASLTVVGDAPADLASEEGVFSVGRLRKEVAAEYESFRSILAGARAVVHPTRSDISPLLLVEAGCFGCPVIATRRFAIPELVENNRTGYLLDDPADVAEVAGLMVRLLDDPNYMAMRRASWQAARHSHTKDQFERRLTEQVRKAVGF